jgi:2-keto-4-pentenoate hydratase/2-oxohepta-3-ene-1,7-dioic acid hydratase in catechol pathway
MPLSLAPRRIVALGLTWRDHVRETGEPIAAAGPAVFERDPRSLAADGRVRVPSRASLLAALERLEPGLGDAVGRRHAALPALLDYEIELGMQLLDDGRTGWFLANDITARTVQILGEGAADRMAFWSASKSFPATMVVGSELLVSDSTPDVELTLRVRGEVRQRARSTQILYSAAEMRQFAAYKGALQPGDVVLTGTPGGIALSVGRWKRAIANLLLGRQARLSAALRSAARGRRFLEPGDVIEMDGGPLGTARAVVQAEG